MIHTELFLLITLFAFEDSDASRLLRELFLPTLSQFGPCFRSFMVEKLTHTVLYHFKLIAVNFYWDLAIKRAFMARSKSIVYCEINRRLHCLFLSCSICCKCVGRGGAGSGFAGHARLGRPLRISQSTNFNYAFACLHQFRSNNCLLQVNHFMANKKLYVGIFSFN